MSDAVTAGSFADFKLVKTRKVAQFVIEFPLERADEALELLGGLPRPDREVWVAIARLKSDPFTNPAPPAAAPTPSPAPAEPKERRPTTNANRAGMMIGEPLFWKWIEAHYPYGCADKAAADQFIKEECGIRSKTELDADLDAAATFDAIRRRYYAWTQEPVS